MEEVYQAEMNRRSNDPFWCLLPEDPPLLARRALHGDPILSGLPSNRLWECLDIATPTTLGALNSSALNYFCPSPSDCAWTFDALTDAQQGSNTLFGATTPCDGKVVGDGTVNSLDMAVLMYAQFGEGPYASVFLPGQTPGRFNPSTTFGREATAHQCGNGMQPNQYQLQLSTDFCLAGHFPPTPPSTPAPSPPPANPPMAPCIGEGVSMDFSSAYLLHNNLGGQGPDSGASIPPSMRFVNAGVVFHPTAGPVHFDIELLTTTSYTPDDVRLNGFVNGKFAQVNLACHQSVGLRATIKRSCATTGSCRACEDLAANLRIACFAAGCSCFGETVFLEADCTTAQHAARRAQYNCPEMGTVLVLPSSALASLTVFDLDTSLDGTVIERLTVPAYEYYKTPLRPASGALVSSSVVVNQEERTFTGTQTSGDPADLAGNPTDPLALGDEQASRGVQFFFRPRFGYIEATFTVSSSGSGNCSSRNLMFAGDSALCAPPPPAPPLSPPPPPPSPPPVLPPPPSPPAPPAAPPPPPPPLFPCIGDSINMDFASVYLLHSNLGDQGPDTSAPPTIRYVNAGSAVHPTMGIIHFDIELTTISSYTPADSNQNGLVNGAFAQINLACGETVGLRAFTRPSCAMRPSCRACENMADQQLRIACYSAGCACFGTTVQTQAACSPSDVATYRSQYSCPAMHMVIPLPSEARIAVTVFDLDTSPDGLTWERVSVEDYEYYKTPLRASSGALVTSTVYANEDANTFTGTAPGAESDLAGNPTNPFTLTDEQASRGVTFFFRPRNGYVDLNFTVSHSNFTVSGSGNCTGRNLMFGGDTALCALPPSMPPPPPSQPAAGRRLNEIYGTPTAAPPWASMPAPAASPPPSSRQLSPPPPDRMNRILSESTISTPAGSLGRYPCLVDMDGQCDGYNDPSLTQYLLDSATSFTSMRHMSAVATKWAELASGRWSRIRLPGTLLAMELFLINIQPGAEPVNSLDPEPPPPFNCASLTEEQCTPAEPAMQVRFRRRAEAMRPGRDPRQCAIVEKSSRNALEGNVLAIRQMPPERAWYAHTRLGFHVCPRCIHPGANG